MTSHVMFIVVLLTTMIYLLACNVDLVMAINIEKKIMLYPVHEFTCFCNWHQQLIGKWMIPNQLYRLYLIRKHMKSCLVWMVHADFNNLVPYWAHQYAEDLRGYKEDSYLTPEWYLNQAKIRSQRVREGRDPFDSTSDTI